LQVIGKIPLKSREDLSLAYTPGVAEPCKEIVKGEDVSIGVSRGNVLLLAFPGILKGALEVRARDITDGMKLAAAKAITDLVGEGERSEERIVPDAEKRVARAAGIARG